MGGYCLNLEFKVWSWMSVAGLFCLVLSLSTYVLNQKDILQSETC